MGRLLTMNEIQDEWYLDNSSWEYVDYKMKRKWPNDNFPAILYIHNDNFSKVAGIKTKIRKWVERNSLGVVVIDYLDYKYRKYYGFDYEYDKSYDISNLWVRFSFEEASDQLAFSLAFDNCVFVATKWHPDRPDDEEYLDRPYKDRFLKYEKTGDN